VSRRGNPVFIGVFVVGALALAAFAAVVFGTGALLKNTATYVMFFGGDVSGLRVGAPVTFRGVPLGVTTESDLTVGEPDDEVYRLLIDNGLRAQLQMQSLVTGQLFVQLDLHPDQPAIFVGGDPYVRELPTIPTPLEIVTRSARKLLERIGELPLEEIIQNLNVSLEGAGRILNSEGAQQLLGNLDATATDLRAVVQRLDGRVEGVASELEGTLTAATSTFDELRSAIGTLGEDSELHYEIESLVREAGAAARSLRVLAETLEQNPEALISGKSEPGGGP
jgi:paraquat-inducible protein B